MEKALQLAVEREARRAGTSRVENKDQILELLNKSTKNLYFSTFHKSRVFVDESDPQNPVVTDKRKDNYDCPVAEFFETCPTQLIFAAALCGCKVKCTKVDTFKAAGFDPNGGPNGTGGTDMDPKHATNATLCWFDFVGKKPEIKDEWLGEDGDEKAAEYLFNFYNPAGE